MSTIRPLATIAVLALVGAFLWWKIDEGPAVALDDPWAPAPEADTAPAWGDSQADPEGAAADGPPSWGESTDDPAPEAPLEAASPSIELLDELPQLPDPTISESQPKTTPTATNEALELPEDIPQANYPTPEQEAPSVSGRVPSLGSATSDLAAEVSPLDAAWPAIEAALARDELTRAHRMLSQWIDDPATPPERREEIESLLAELAGTVVYSMEHRLEPPHVVAQGETLATIADDYEVPWRLLAKINSIATIDGVTPGQSLKVVRGPFDARVDLNRGEIVLLLDDRYAGKFAVTTAGATLREGRWRVGEKKNQAGADSSQSLVLQDARGGQVELSADTAPASGERLSVASRDMGDLFDILSVGSSVTIVR